MSDKLVYRGLHSSDMPSTPPELDGFPLYGVS